MERTEKFLTEEEFKEISYVEKNKKCPKCKSKQISIHKGIQIAEEQDLTTEKILYRSNFGDVVFWMYKCRKCNWESGVCSE